MLNFLAIILNSSPTYYYHLQSISSAFVFLIHLLNSFSLATESTEARNFKEIHN